MRTTTGYYLQSTGRGNLAPPPTIGAIVACIDYCYYGNKCLFMFAYLKYLEHVSLLGILAHWSL